MDVDLHYREQGTGEPLILLHGNGEDGSYFERQMDAFASRFRVIALDTRGHGRSPRGEAPFTIRQFADDLLAFMDGQGIERAHLLGFSDGGNIALAFALAHPERVGKLVLNGANLDGGGVKPSVQLPIVAGYGGGVALRALERPRAPQSRNAEPHGERPEHRPGGASRAEGADTGGSRHEGHDQRGAYQVDREEHSRRKAGLRGGGSLRGCGEPRGVQQGREEVFGKLINLARMLMQYACKLHNASEKSGSRECRKTGSNPV